VAKLMSAHLTLHNICSLIVDYMRGGVVDDGNSKGVVMSNIKIPIMFYHRNQDNNYSDRLLSYLRNIK
jgi:hypothetical protein